MPNGTRGRARSFLVYGFAISVAVHLIVLPFVRTTPTVAKDEPPPTILHRDPIPTPPPTPRPTPTPAPTVPPTQPPREKPQTPQPQPPRQPLRINPPHQDAHHGAGNAENPSAHATGDPNGVPHGEETTAPLAKFAPDTVRVKAAPPAVILLGDSCVMVGVVAATVPFLEL